MNKPWITKTVIALSLFQLWSFPIPQKGAAQENPAAIYQPVDIEKHWAESLIYDYVEADNVKGYNVNGTYYIRPDRFITRAEFAAILVRSLGLTSSGPGTQFSDVKAGEWYADIVRIASASGIITGYANGEFRPNLNIQRDEMAAMVFRAFHDTVTPRDEYNTYSDVPLYYDPKTGKYNNTYWAAEAIQGASARQIFNGYTDRTFRPFTNATRAEAIKVLSVGVHRENEGVLVSLPVTDLVRDYEWAYYNFMNDKKYDDGYTTNVNYLVGHLKALSDQAINDVKAKVQQGWTVDIRMVRAPVAVIYNPQGLLLNGELYQRYAVASLTGEYELTFTRGAETQRVILNVDSLLYLKKVNNTNWKIYASTKL